MSELQVIKNGDQKKELPEGVIAIIKLKKPIKDQDDKTHTELHLREPTTADYIELGDTHKIIQGNNGEMSIVGNTAVALPYAERCTGIHAVYLEKMHVHDMMRLSGALINFFGQASQET